MDLEVDLFIKDDFKFSRLKKNQYTIEFTIENNNINISKIIDFNLIQLIYELNPDIYENVNIQKLNDNEIIATLLLKHFFEDLGLSQKFLFIHLKKNIEDKNVIFKSTTIKNNKPEGIPEEAELIIIKELINSFYTITPHKVKMINNIIFDPLMIIPILTEKMIGTILHKMFKRVKQFIENIII